MPSMSLPSILAIAAAIATTPAPVEAPPTPVVFPSFDKLPGVGDAAIAELGRRALAAEARDDDAPAAATYEEIAARLPRSPEPRWHAARSHWDSGRRLPADDVDGRRREYRLAVEWADRGIE